MAYTNTEKRGRNVHCKTCGEALTGSEIALGCVTCTDDDGNLLDDAPQGFTIEELGEQEQEEQWEKDGFA